MALAAGELASAEESAAQAHLVECLECSREIARLIASINPSPDSSVQVPSPDSVLQGIQSWEQSHPRELNVSEIKSRAENELAPYLGSAAAARVMERISPDGRDLLARIESVLALFLGCSAAAELTSRIVDRSIVQF